MHVYSDNRDALPRGQPARLETGGAIEEPAGGQPGGFLHRTLPGGP
jgi:hypothetical protein